MPQLFRIIQDLLYSYRRASGHTGFGLGSGLPLAGYLAAVAFLSVAFSSSGGSAGTVAGTPDGAKTPPHWAYSPISSPTPPETRDAKWARTDIDRFILATLEVHGLRPAHPADERTLIRRASFDLVGLPPDPEAVDAFEADNSPTAFAAVVERLLASPRYGERWGRHWLDVARYADSNGMDENLAYANAWRYRDYVIAAFNEDRPYDEFIRDQLAGDLADQTMPGAGGMPRRVATAFLCIGPKMLAEDDQVKMEMDIVDEQLDTSCRVFMGVTTGCARCHDHKFDPISTAEYYAMAGIFKSTRTMENFKVVARWQESPVGSPEEMAALEAQLSRVKKQESLVAEVMEEGNKELLERSRGKAARYLVAAVEALSLDRQLDASRLTTEGATDQDGRKRVLLEAEKFRFQENLTVFHTGYGEGIGVIAGGSGTNVVEYEVPISQAGLYRVDLRYAAANARPVRIMINGECVKTNAASLVTGSWNPDTQRWSVEGFFAFPKGTSVVRLERSDSIPHIDKLLFFESTESEAARFAQARERGTGTPGLVPEFVSQWKEYLKGSKGKADEAERLIAERDEEKILNTVREVFGESVQDPKGPFALPKEPEHHYTPDLRSKLEQERKQLKELEAATPRLPEAMVVREGKVQDLRVHHRGSHLLLRGETPRGFLQSVGGPPAPTLGTNRSGRLELANWMTDPAHPLTARVMVNRIWRWHFGEGLVRSPDNFGQLGEKPTHPELLDWLARRFMASGWSIKSMHRLIMNSAVYQQSVTPAEPEERSRPTETVDPENRLWSHCNRRRLEVEAIRDAIFYVSGSLDFQRKDSLLSIENRTYVTGAKNNMDTAVYQQPVRAVYLPVVRSTLDDLFQAFDFPDPSVLNGDRDQTVVASQALFMMNSRLVADQSLRLAKDLLGKRELEDKGRVQRLYRLAYGRLPTEREYDRAVGYVARYGGRVAALGKGEDAGRVEGWRSLCRLVMAANEFIHVE